MTAVVADAPRRSPYIVGPLYDWGFFILSPLFALAAGIAISGSDFSDAVVGIAGLETTMAAFLLGSLIHAHLVAVLFRSHANPMIFRRHWIRFTLVPIILWLAITTSLWVAITATVVSTFWDVWHSGAQTFGFARIYDRNQGNRGDQGRTLDLWLNQLLYAGPILGGATMLDHVEAFDDFDQLGSAFLTSIPVYATGIHMYMTFALLIVGTVFIAVYVGMQLRLHAQGHSISPLKTIIIANTGLCSIYTWGLNSWGEAFFIMNLFHAVQYLALVWATERKNLVVRFGVAERKRAAFWAAALFLGSIGVYGVAAQRVDSDFKALWAVTIVVSLMHFWYDGFVWSVRASQI